MNDIIKKERVKYFEMLGIKEDSYAITSRNLDNKDLLN
jgi:hypothetical protein